MSDGTTAAPKRVSWWRADVFGRDGRDRQEPVEDIDVERELWPGKRTRTQHAEGHPVAEPGKRSSSHGLKLDVDTAFAGWVTQAEAATQRLDIAIGARDFTEALAAKCAVERALELLRRAITGPDASARRAQLRDLERRVEPLLARAPVVSDRAYAERFRGPREGSRETWDREEQAWSRKPASTDGANRIAARGVSGPATAFPHLDRIQASFGRHDLGHVTAHDDATASIASRELGARAYAFGDHVAFGQTPDLHTAAHEAAHVVQQRAGIAAAGGTGSDAFERHADAVADAVIAGRSAEGLLDPVAGRGRTTTPIIQRVPENTPTHRPVVGKEPGLPPPVLFVVGGDRFEVDLVMLDGVLTARMRYLGGERFTVDGNVTRLAVIPLRPMHLKNVLDKWVPGFQTVVVKQTADVLTFDLYGDNTAILEIRALPQDRYSDGDTRGTMITALINRKYAGQAIPLLEVHLPPAVDAASAAARTPSTSDDKAVSVKLDLDGEAVELTARRWGDSEQIALSLQNSGVVIVPLLFRLKDVGLRVLDTDGQNITLDLDNDGKADATLIYTTWEIKSSTSPGMFGAIRQRRAHFLDTYDANGRRVGQLFNVTTRFKKDIPPHLLHKSSQIITGVGQDDRMAPVQEDVIGEQSIPHHYASHDWELRFDGDGDRKKELVLRIWPKDPRAPGKPAKYRVSLRNLDTLAIDTKEMDFTADQADAFEDGFGPQLTNPAGVGNAVITLNPDTSKAPLHLELQFQHDTHLYWVAVKPAGTLMIFDVKSEAPSGELTDSKKNDEVGDIAGIKTMEMPLGEYGDKFRFTVERAPQNRTAMIFGVTAVGPGPAVSGLGYYIGGRSYASLKRMSVSSTSITFDTDGDGQADLNISDVISAPLKQRVNDRDDVAMPSLDRDHRIFITDHARYKGPHPSLLPGDLTFQIRGGQLVSHYDKGVTQRYAAGAGQSVEVLVEQSSRTSVLDERVHTENALIEAASAAIVASKLDGADRVIAEWRALEQSMALLVPGAKPEASRIAKAKASTLAIITWLRAVAPMPQEIRAQYEHTNVYTGESVRKTAGHSPVTTAFPFANRLLGDLDARKLDIAAESYHEMSEGLFNWARDQLVKSKGKDATEVLQLDELHATREEQRSIEKQHPNAFRVPGTFIADDSFSHESDFGAYRVVPMQMYVWKEGSTWHISDLTNGASKPFRGSADENPSTPDLPPRALFEELNNVHHFPKGVIRYFLPTNIEAGDQGRANNPIDPHKGTGDQIVCDAHKTWADHVKDLGMALAVVGLIAATGGLGLVATAAFAASAIIGTVGAVMEIQEAYSHNYADAKLVGLNVLDIVMNLATLGTLSTGRAITSAALRTAEGAEVTATTAIRFAKAAYVPMMSVQIASNAVSVLVMAHDTIAALDEIDATITDPSARLVAKAKLIGTVALMGGLQLMAIHGDLPQLWKKSPIVIDRINGVNIVRASGVDIGGHTVNLDKANANTHATGRWGSRELANAAAQEAHTDHGKAARAILNDEGNTKLFAKWMEQPHKLTPEGKVIPPEGASAELIADMQRFADGGHLKAQEKAFAFADQIEKAGHGLDLDVQGPNWPPTRDKLVAALGGSEDARQAVQAFELARQGSSAKNLVGFMSQRVAISRFMPESEIDALRRAYPDAHVYVTGDLAKAGAHHGGGAVEIVVVAAKETPPESLAAMEKRLDNHKVRPEKEWLVDNRQPLDTTFGVKVKVVTNEQFAGMAMTPGNGSFHKLDAAMPDLIGGKVRQIEGNRYAADAADLLGSHEAWKKRGGSEKVSPIHYDARTNKSHYEIELSHGETIHIEAQLPPRIRHGNELVDGTNRIVGAPIKSQGNAQDLLRKLNRGDLASLSEVGVQVGKDIKLPADTEFGLGRTADGEWVIVRGAGKEVDWERLPGIEPKGHTHPDVPENDLPEELASQHPDRLDPVTRKTRISITDLADTKEPFGHRDLIYPSAPDIGLMGRRGIKDHLVPTGFVEHDGYIMKPRPGDEGRPRVDFIIKSSKQVGKLGDAIVYEAEIVGEVGGKPILHHKVWAIQEGDGTGYLRGEEPPNMVHDAAPVEVTTTTKGDGLPAGKSFFDVRVQLEAAVKPQLDALPERPDIIVMPAEEFARSYGSDRGNAVFTVDKTGKPVIYARPEATPGNILEELQHSRQYSDPKLGGEVRMLADELAHRPWATASARDKMTMFRRKLALEIDAQRAQIVDAASNPQIDRAHAEVTLANLRELQRRAEAITDAQLARISANAEPLPDFLEDPAYLFAKVEGIRGGKRPDRTAVTAKTPRVKLPKNGTSRSAAYNTRKDVVSVSRVGDSWSEYTAVVADEGGTVRVVGGDVIVRTKSGKEILHVVENKKAIKVKTGDPVRKGEILAEESDRQYRLVEIELADGSVDFREEIRSADGDGWVQRGSESTRRGKIMEMAAQLQADARLADVAADAARHGAYFEPQRIKHSRGGGGFDDVIVEFTGHPKHPDALIRIREVKDYPNKYVPFDEFTAITRSDLKNNWQTLETMVDDTISGRDMTGTGLERFSAEQLVAIKKAIATKSVQVEIVLGPETYVGQEAMSTSEVAKSVRASIKTVLKTDALVKLPPGRDFEHVDPTYVAAARDAYDAAAKASKAP